MKGAASDPPEVAGTLWSGWSGYRAFDVGSHLGEAIAPLQELGFERIECFEPSSEAFSALALEHLDDPYVRLHRVAISDHDGTLDLSVRETAIQSGQLVAAGMPYEDYIPGVTSVTEESLPWGKELATRTVLCRTLDSFSRDLGVPDFVKVDTEGSEADVLRGARRILAFGVTGFLIEFHSEDRYDDCVKTLEEAGYAPEKIEHPHYSRHATKGNLIRHHGWIRAPAPRLERDQTVTSELPKHVAAAART